MLYIRHIFSVYLSLFWFGRATDLTRQRISPGRAWQRGDGWEPTIDFSRSTGAERAAGPPASNAHVELNRQGHCFEDAQGEPKGKKPF